MYTQVGNTVRQQLKEWYQKAKAKKGKLRRTLDVSSCFAALLLWVISLLPAESKRIALALDAPYQIVKCCNVSTRVSGNPSLIFGDIY
ncbi:hypothetical protein [Nostoc sp. FACHB-133]|uniref:hypothetical protein n=1 Tax=Nostoc sp. FACHB-133 TaxID=2692835 RepID=UPI0016886686|nr:hypothetical protein [Nostoc sp. FACHB-133]MBD2524569.1 hypothetical protein [Nostoc sp. FACHB-133]